MKTPYGEIPERFVKDMSAQEMHDYLQRRYSRRGFLKGADLVINGHNHICAGGGGAGLAASATSGWYGKSGGGDLATTGTGTPLIEV